jgi:hypothetical protein
MAVFLHYALAVIPTVITPTLITLLNVCIAKKMYLINEIKGQDHELTSLNLRRSRVAPYIQITSCCTKITLNRGYINLSSSCN